MVNLELLAPAKNLECGIEAIKHGADAVYIGASRYGARAAAGNSTEDIAALCQFAHQYGAKVYVTVNTIIYDKELEDTTRLVGTLQEIGADAILIQDLGLYKALRERYDKIAFHASTQTDNRTVEKVRWLAEQGFRRVVLARELSIEEIVRIHREVPDVELEVFVHGALCVSYSGQCYASQHCFGRSANRGECAQFCRMPFTLTDADGRTIAPSCHILSLKDMAQIENIERLAQAGAVSFKVEGRLKDADYVKNVTAAYSEKLNEICRKNPEKYARASKGRCSYTFQPDIRKSFNRGFTTYFADGRQGNLASFNTPKALGEPVGRVKEIRGKSFNVSTTTSFSNGDGLCFFNHDKQLVGFRVNKAEGNRLFPLAMPQGLTPGTMLYRNLDHTFQALLSKPSAERKIDIDLHLRIDKDCLTLMMTDDSGSTKEATMPYDYQEAQKPQDDNIQRQLSKLGGTIFTCRSLSVESSVKQPFIQSSLLAELRRKLTQPDVAKPLKKDFCGDEMNFCGEGTNHSGKEMYSCGAGMKPEQGHTDKANAPRYAEMPYLYNASNALAKAFYKEQGIDGACSFEEGGTHRTGSVVMQCRYCIRAEMGYCTKSGRKMPWREPLSISLADGRTFTLKFNCKQCEMEVLI